MFQCEIKVECPQEVTKSRKPFANLPITTPWKYRVPSNSIPQKNKIKLYLQNANLKSESLRQTVPISNVYKNNVGSNFEKQYYHFLRLMYLFPSVHPANIHGILLTCNYDICRAVDKLRRAIRLVKGSYPPNINRNDTINNNYYNPQIMPRYSNKFYNNYYNRNTHHLRNYFNGQIPVSINKPNSVLMVPNCYNGPKTYFKYDNISKNVYG